MYCYINALVFWGVFVSMTDTLMYFENSNSSRTTHTVTDPQDDTPIPAESSDPASPGEDNPPGLEERFARLEELMEKKYQAMIKWQENNNAILQQSMAVLEQANQQLHHGLQFYSQMVQMKVAEMEVKYERAFLFTGFTAVGMTNQTYEDRHNILEFSNVITNIGGSFNFDSGVFLCPYDAYYYFEFRVNFRGGFGSRCDLMRDTIELISVTAMDEEDGDDDRYYEKSNSIIALCKAGQHVFVRGSLGEGQHGFDYRGDRSSFSGYVVASV